MSPMLPVEIVHVREGEGKKSKNIILYFNTDTCTSYQHLHILHTNLEESIQVDQNNRRNTC